MPTGIRGTVAKCIRCGRKPSGRANAEYCPLCEPIVKMLQAQREKAQAGRAQAEQDFAERLAAQPPAKTSFTGPKSPSADTLNKRRRSRPAPFRQVLTAIESSR